MAWTAKQIKDLNRMNKAAQNVSLGTTLADLGAFDVSDISGEVDAIQAIIPAAAGTAEASKILQLGADKNIDVVAVADLKLGVGAGTSVTATADEINVLDNVAAGTVAASSAVVVDASKNISRFETIGTDALDMSSGTPVSHPINMEGLTLANNTNAIRGASVNPTRTSGWTSFSGTVGATPAQVYTDYRELHTTGVAEVLGFGLFPYMDATASCASMFAGQDIAYVSAGATVLSAAGAPATGIFARWMKTVLDGETFTSGGVAAAFFASVQANVTDVQAEDTSIGNFEVASGGIQNVFKLQCTAAKGATYLFNFTDDNGEPVSASNGTDLADISATANAGWIKIRVGSGDKYIALYDKKAA